MSETKKVAKRKRQSDADGDTKRTQEPVFQPDENDDYTSRQMRYLDWISKYVVLVKCFRHYEHEPKSVIMNTKVSSRGMVSTSLYWNKDREPFEIGELVLVAHAGGIGSLGRVVKCLSRKGAVRKRYKIRVLASASRKAEWTSANETEFEARMLLRAYRKEGAQPPSTPDSEDS